MDFSDYLIPIVAVFLMSIATSFIANRREFSLNIFMASMAIGISILVWVKILPIWTIVISVLIIVLMLFTEKGGTISGE